MRSDASDFPLSSDRRRVNDSFWPDLRGPFGSLRSTTPPAIDPSGNSRRLGINPTGIALDANSQRCPHRNDTAVSLPKSLAASIDTPSASAYGNELTAVRRPLR